MASLIYTSNKLGTVSGPGSASGSVNITFTSKAQADSITITLFCHACHQVISSQTVRNVEIGDVRIVSFDLSSLEASGHPGPFEFTPTGGTGEIYYDLVLTDDPPGAARTISGAGSYLVPFGGSLELHIGCTESDGYAFSAWYFEDGRLFSTTRNTWWLTSNITSDTYRHLIAKFRSLAGVFVQAFIETLPTLPNIAYVKDELTEDTAESMTKVAQEGEYSVTYSFRALRMSARCCYYGRYSSQLQDDGTWDEWSYSTNYSARGTTSRSRKYKFQFRELNAVRIVVRFHGYGHATHGASVSLFVLEENDYTNIPISQGPFSYTSNGTASLYTTNDSNTSFGTGYGTLCYVNFKINIGNGFRFVRATTHYTNSTGSTEFTQDFLTVEALENGRKVFYFRGNEINAIDIFIACDLLIYNVTGYLIYNPVSNALIYCG